MDTAKTKATTDRSAQTDLLHRIWEVGIQIAGGRPHLAVLLAAAKKENIPVTWETFHALSARLQGGDVIVVPYYITDFLNTWIADRKPQSILDPWAGVGSLLLPITEANSIKNAVGISPSEQALAG